MRTQVAPGVWRDDGPQAAHVRYNQFAVQAVTVASMVPVLTYGEANPVTSGEYQRRQKRLAATRAARS